MTIRPVNAGLQKIWSSRHRRLWPALVFSILGHGLLLHGLSSRGSFRSQFATQIVHGEILVNIRKEVAPEASIASASESEPLVTVDQVDKLVEPIESPSQKGVDGTQTYPLKNNVDEHVESVQQDGDTGPNEQSSETGCMGQKEEDIPDIGQSNRVGRRKQVAPCDLG